ncbi:ATP-binding protein [Butyrivibrio fibrisolvens]|uniref:ATP-binding protein n=1 Tax=Butyrivibrio fibrisolvens TaxID=831 RepID=UPI0004106643|nr:ATP-binding protein [Butyrivibrio fibrisolvens]
MEENILLSIFQNANFISFAISLGASFTWDAIKKRLTKEKSPEILLFDAFCETFRQYYSKNGLEFYEEQVMNNFIIRVQQYQGVGGFSSLGLEQLDTKLFEDIIMPEYSDLSDFNDSCNQFIYYLCTTLAKPKYDIIRHQLVLSKYIKPVTNDDKAWMTQYMQDNWCSIEVPDFEGITNILDQVKTSLNPDIWKCLKDFVSEVVYNAQKHGQADNCKIKITNNTIRITDNGPKFNPMSLENCHSKGGGAYALQFLLEMLPDLRTKYSFRNNTNSLTVLFDTDVFDINSMCEVKVPDLRFKVAPVLLYEGKYKYCYADICKSLSHLNNKFNISGLIGLIRYADNMIEKKVFEKFFIYFSTTNTGASDEVYHRYRRILSDRKNKDIILLPEITEDAY